MTQTSMPTGAEPGECRSCSAPVLWVRTVNGHRMPLDPEPTDGGTMVPAAYRGEWRALRKHEPHAGPKYRSHFASCEHAAKHRRTSA